MLSVAVITLEKMALGILPDRGYLLSAALQLRICSDVCPAHITIYNAACVLEHLAFEDTWELDDDACELCGVLAEDLKQLMRDG